MKHSGSAKGDPKHRHRRRITAVMGGSALLVSATAAAASGHAPSSSGPASAIARLASGVQSSVDRAALGAVRTATAPAGSRSAGVVGKAPVVVQGTRATTDPPQITTTTAPPSTTTSTVTSPTTVPTTTSTTVTVPTTTSTTRVPPTTTTVPPTTTTTTVAPSTTTTTVPSSPAPAGVPGSWGAPVFDDEFNGSTLDSSKWTPNFFGSSSTALTKSADSPTTYDPSQVSVASGNLVLTAVTKSELGLQYTSGCVTTAGKFTIAPTASAPVAMEARLYLPAAPSGGIANWPAFWASGATWPNDGEIDTFEGLSGSAAYHFHYGTQSAELSEGASVSGSYTGWHTFGVVWTTSSLTFYYDGADVGSLTAGVTDQPMPIIINLAVGAYGGPVVTPSSMLVNYVRVWSLRS